MNIELKLARADEAYIFKNLWPLYQHDVSEFDSDFVTNRHGLFGVEDDVTTLAEHADGLSSWWQDSRALYPYLIWVDGRPAGFNLVAARPRLPEGLDADFVVHEFFVLHAFRGKRVAERAAVEGFDRHRGKWEVVTWPSNVRAISFWRRVCSAYAREDCPGVEVDHPWGRRVAFGFDNG